MNSKFLFDLKGKTVLITGGAGHLGSSISEGLAAFGANIFVLGQDEAKNKSFANSLKQEYALSVCEGLHFDVADSLSIEKNLEYIYEQTGSIDVLINNAAYSSAGKVEAISEDDWCRGIDGTINSVFRVTKGVLKYMIPARNGNIINIASMYGMVAPDPSIYGDSGEDNPANYGAGKAAVIQFTKYIAATYGKLGIRANTISPGAFPCAQVQTNKEFVKNLCAKNPMGRIGKPEDLQGLIIYLSSDSSGYMTGQNIAVDGGWTAW